MKLKDFISQFSHNNAMWVENKKRHMLPSRYNKDGDKYVFRNEVLAKVKEIKEILK